MVPLLTSVSAIFTPSSKLATTSRYLPDRGGGGGLLKRTSFSRAWQFPGVVLTASSSPSSLCSCGYSEILNFDFGSSRSGSPRRLRVQAMSATAQRKFSLSKGDTDDKNEPDHLLVLVHGILASPNDWLYVEAEMKRRFGRRFLIYASSSNTFTKKMEGLPPSALGLFAQAVVSKGHENGTAFGMIQVIIKVTSTIKKPTISVYYLPMDTTRATQ